MLIAGRYRIDKPIAAGGMGEVWQATDELLGRTVSVKFLHAQYASDESFLERMLREARAASAVNHPGVVAVYDFGRIDREDELTMSYIVMELVDGPSLSQVLLEGPLSIEQTLTILEQTAAALAAAHQAGVVHRDVKPGNILMSPDGHVKLTDFGIARSQDASTITESGSITGTAHYLSPEQAGGGTATASSDLYSLGVVIYSCLAGTVPFDRDGPVAIALAHIKDEPPPLPDSVPAGVSELVMSLLEKEPENRPENAAVVSRKAAALLGGDRHTELVTPLAATGLQHPAAAAAATSVNSDPAGATVVTEPTEEEEGERRRRPLSPFLIAAAALAAFALVAAYLIFGRETAPQVTVPSLVGLSRDEALAKLNELDLDAKFKVEDVAKKEAGIVVEQSEEAGSSVDVDSEITLTVASGMVDLPVDDIIGSRYRKAQALLADLGLEARRVTRSSSVDPGTVLDIRGGSRRAVGSTVVLVVAKTPPPTPTPVPTPKPTKTPKPKPTPTEPTTEPPPDPDADVDADADGGADADVDADGV
jgi:serine/threonine-protein kinase